MCMIPSGTLTLKYVTDMTSLCLLTFLLGTTNFVFVTKLKLFLKNNYYNNKTKQYNSISNYILIKEHHGFCVSRRPRFRVKSEKRCVQMIYIFRYIILLSSSEIRILSYFQLQNEYRRTCIL